MGGGYRMKAESNFLIFKCECNMSFIAIIDIEHVALLKDSCRYCKMKNWIVDEVVLKGDEMSAEDESIYKYVRKMMEKMVV